MSRSDATVRDTLVTGSTRPPFVSTWSRRFVSISLYLVLSALLLTLLPLLLAAAALIDLAQPRRRGASLRTLAFFLFYFGCELAGIAAASVLWLRHALGGSRRAFLDANFRLQCRWAELLRRGAFRLYSMKLSVEGAEVAEPGPVLVFVRHASVADTMLPTMLVSTPHGIVLRWVMKRELLWDPCLDIVGNRLQNCFVSRAPDESARSVEDLSQLMGGLGELDGVVIYPEGTRFTPAKRQRLIAKLRERGDERGHHDATLLEHVLPPRRGGTLALLGNNPGADLLFCAHVGLEGAGSFGDLWRGELVGKTVHIALWRVAFADIPRGAEAQMRFVTEHWRRVDAFVAAHRVSP